eukprot:2628662-Rhodomonas_salina.1
MSLLARCQRSTTLGTELARCRVCVGVMKDVNSVAALWVECEKGRLVGGAARSGPRRFTAAPPSVRGVR